MFRNSTLCVPRITTIDQYCLWMDTKMIDMEWNCQDFACIYTVLSNYRVEPVVWRCLGNLNWNVVLGLTVANERTVFYHNHDRSSRERVQDTNQVVWADVPSLEWLYSQCHLRYTKMAKFQHHIDPIAYNMRWKAITTTEQTSGHILRIQMAICRRKFRYSSSWCVMYFPRAYYFDKSFHPFQHS